MAPVDPIVCALLVEAMAQQTMVESMKAENAMCAAAGQPPKYGESVFEGAAAGLMHTATALRNRA